MANRVLECKMCHARYKLPEGSAATSVTCKRCGNPVHVTGDNGAAKRRKTTGSSRATGLTMSGTPTRRRAGQAASYALIAVAAVAIAGTLYWLS